MRACKLNFTPLDVEGTGQHLCDLDPKVKDQIMNFLVNASPPKPLDVTTSNSVGA